MTKHISGPQDLKLEAPFELSAIPALEAAALAAEDDEERRAFLISLDEVTLQFLQKYVAQVLSDSELNLVKPKLRLEWQIQYLDGMIATLSAGVLADHLEHKEATYDVVELPRWLKWLNRFTVRHTRLISLDAYHTYPKANIKLPDLGPGYTEFIKQDFEL